MAALLPDAALGLAVFGAWLLALLIIPFLATSASVFVSWLLVLLILAMIAGTFCVSMLCSLATACYYNAHKE